jgi:hypothetical protein
MSSGSTQQQGARGPQHEHEQPVSSQEAGKPLSQSVRRKRNVVLHQLSLAVGTVQRVNAVLRDIDALTDPREDQGENHHDDDGHTNDAGGDGDADVASAAAAADPHETRESQASLQHARSVSVKQRLLLDELKRWKDA